MEGEGAAKFSSLLGQRRGEGGSGGGGDGGRHESLQLTLRKKNKAEKVF